MKRTFQITGVKNITNIERPIVVLEVEGQELGIARRPKQFLLDIQNSHLPVSDNLTPSSPEYKTVLRNLIGGKVEGDIKFFKAGDKYTVTEGHPALTDTTHELYDKVKEGDTLKAKSDGAWVEGFLTLDYNKHAEMIDAFATKSAQAFASMFGGAFTGMNQPVAQQSDQPELAVSNPMEEAVGKKQ